MVKKLGKSIQFALNLVGTEVWSALSHSAPTVARFMAVPSHGIVSIKIVYRGNNDFLAVAKRYGDTGVLEVCFGSGPDAIGCLLGLDAAMDADKWRPDKWANQSSK